MTRLACTTALATAFAAFAAPAAASPAIELTLGVHPFVDRLLIAETSGVTHTLLPPVPRETVLTLDRPWEGPMSGYGTVFRDHENRVRIYYRGGGDIDPPEVTCIALSADGMVFERPLLRQFEVRGTLDNNVVYTASDRPSYGESHNFAPFLDSHPTPHPGRLYKAVALRVAENDEGQHQRMLAVLDSADGFHWQHMTSAPVMRHGGFDSLNTAFYDAPRGEYACYFRTSDRGLRSFSRASSMNFTEWTARPPLRFSPAQDEQWYTNGITPCPGRPSLLIALPMRFVPERKTVGHPPRQTDGLSDAVLLTSRDGASWDRTFPEALIRPGPNPANWGDAHGNNTPLSGIIETAPGEWSIYWFENYGTGTPHIRRGTVRAHGLACMRAGTTGGMFTTPALRLPADATTGPVSLNMATSAKGFVSVEVLDAAGRPMPGFPSSGEIWGDSAALPVPWPGDAGLPADRAFRLRFTMRDADLFAIAIR